MAFVFALRKFTIKSYVFLSWLEAHTEQRKGKRKAGEGPRTRPQNGEVPWHVLMRALRMLRLLQSGEFRVEISAARLSLCPLRPRLSFARSDLDTGQAPVEKLLSVGERPPSFGASFAKWFVWRTPRTCSAKSFAIVSQCVNVSREACAVWVCTRKLLSTAENSMKSVCNTTR